MREGVSSDETTTTQDVSQSRIKNQVMSSAPPNPNSQIFSILARSWRSRPSWRRSRLAHLSQRRHGAPVLVNGVVMNGPPDEASHQPRSFILLLNDKSHTCIYFFSVVAFNDTGSNDSGFSPPPPPPPPPPLFSAIFKCV